jgi:aminoglycoside phosphotransferase (APT) family kinase protein
LAATDELPRAMPFALSKTRVPRDVAQAAVDAHFGARHPIREYTELTDGMYNAAYLIELDGGLKTVLKVAPSDVVKVLRYEKGIMKAEVDVLRLLRARTDLPVPDVFAYDTSRRLLDNDYYLMSYVPGVSLFKLRRSLSAEERHAVDLRTGQYLRQINSIEGRAFGCFAQEEYQRATWRDAFETMLAHVLQDGRDAGVELPLPYAEINARLAAHFSSLEHVATPALVHWDLWDGNIFVDPETKTITGILDCERALWGDPLMEINFGAFGVNPAVREGYGIDLLAAPDARTRRALYNAYLWLIMIVECTYRAYDNRDQEQRARAKLVEEIDMLGA